MKYFNNTAQQNCRFKNKSGMIAQVDVFATWVYKFQELNTIPYPPEKFRKQVVKTFSRREGWLYIGIKGDSGVNSKEQGF